MVGPKAKRKAVRFAIEEMKHSERAACDALGLNRTTYRYQPKTDEKKVTLIREMYEHAKKHPRYGYRRIHNELKEAGWKDLNLKRVELLWRREGLQVPQKQQKRKRVGVSTAERKTAERINQVWSWDFIHDRLENGDPLKILVIFDEYTRRCLSLKVARNITHHGVLDELLGCIDRYGLPEHIRSDNGPELIAEGIQSGMQDRDIKAIYITPGSPWENAFVESFNSRFRDELLNRELFCSLLEARVVIEDWRQEYNERRPHSALNYKTPALFAEEAA